MYISAAKYTHKAAAHGQVGIGMCEERIKKLPVYYKKAKKREGRGRGEGRDVPSRRAEARFSLLCRTSAKSSSDCWRTERSLLCSSLFCGCGVGGGVGGVHVCVCVCVCAWVSGCCMYVGCA